LETGVESSTQHCKPLKLKKIILQLQPDILISILKNILGKKENASAE